MTRQLMKGNEAIAEAAIRVGAKRFFGYPITPQNEVADYLSKRLPAIGGVFVQAESEVAASNMLFGAASSGLRVFTTSSSPGISLMQEAISYMAGAHLPVVIVNIMRAGPGLGGILPSQSDYFQATKGGGHGDYRVLVLAPSSVQEAVDLVQLAFDLADKYRNPVMVAGDGMIGQMMEPVEFDPAKKEKTNAADGWATTGAKGRAPRIIRSLHLDPTMLEKNNIELAGKYERMNREEVRFEEYAIESGTEIVLVAYGSMARICKTVIDDLREEKIPVGLIRPISLFPFPLEEIRKVASRPNVKVFLSVEMSMGQMVEDVERAAAGQKPVRFFGRAGGIVPSPDEVAAQVRKLAAEFGKASRLSTPASRKTEGGESHVRK
ncbi:MAG: 3-methyl-2-oxobutanoate dehydrogenase subunit VorB [Pseudomonadota bacterium]